MKQAAPLPWTYDRKERVLHDADGKPVALLWDGRSEAQSTQVARRIIRALTPRSGSGGP